MRELTARQEAVLRFIHSHIQSLGYAPSIRAVGLQFGIRTLRGVTIHLDALKHKGYIQRSSLSRSVRLCSKAYSRLGEPMLADALYALVAARAADEHTTTCSVCQSGDICTEADTLRTEAVALRSAVLAQPALHRSAGESSTLAPQAKPERCEALPVTAREPVACPTLTPRQAHVLRMAADGLSAQVIAAELAITKGSVDHHLCTIYRRFNVHTKIQAINLARKHGLLTTSER